MLSHPQQVGGEAILQMCSSARISSAPFAARSAACQFHDVANPRHGRLGTLGFDAAPGKTMNSGRSLAKRAHQVDFDVQT